MLHFEFQTLAAFGFFHEFFNFCPWNLHGILWDIHMDIFGSFDRFVFALLFYGEAQMRTGQGDLTTGGVSIRFVLILRLPCDYYYGAYKSELIRFHIKF